MRLLFFGKLGDAAGGREHNFELPEDVSTITELIKTLSDENPALGAAIAGTCVQFVVNNNIVTSDAAISNGDEIGFLPPVSGG